MTRATKAVPPNDAPPRLVIVDLCAPSILEPYLRRAAAYIAEDFPAARADLVQEARITLWQLDLSRFPQSAATYLKRILYTRMLRVYRIECLEGLTTGWSPHADRGKRKAPRKAPAAPPRMPKAA
jgi:DNA-directed RNA polymerase specialized sigma24 family protein